MANRQNKRSGQKSASNGNRSSLKARFSEHRTYTIPDYRLEKPNFTIRQIRKGDEICYEVEGNLNTSVPPIRESKYLSKQQHIELYRWMLLNRKMAQALENLYKPGKVVGGVYFGLGLVLFVENNLWGYSTPADMQFRVEDLAERAIAYGIPGVIVDGTDACQVYDAAHEACERARRGEGPTLIEAKMMRMKGHAIHDAADYVPKPLFEYWRKRDPIARFENHLVSVKKWLTREENEKLIADVDRQLEEDRDYAVASPMPSPESAAGGVYCDGCHEIKPKYRMANTEARSSATIKIGGAH